MKSNKRLLEPESDATEAERRLLEAARPKDPPAGARERVAARLARDLDKPSLESVPGSAPQRKTAKARRGNRR